METTVQNYTLADGEFYKTFTKGTTELRSYGQLVEGQILSFNDIFYEIVWIDGEEYNSLLLEYPEL